MRALILAVLLLLPQSVLAATSPVGVWRIDRASLESTLDRLIQGLVERLPADQQAPARQAMAGQRAAIQAQMAKSVAARIEFKDDGSVVFTDPASKDSEVGSWRQDGEVLHVVDTDPESPDLTGKVGQDRIDLGFDVDRSDPEQAPLADLLWVLVPAAQ